MKIVSSFQKFLVSGSEISLKRGEGGVVHIQAQDAEGQNRALGFVHAHERLNQMLLTRVLASGKITEYLGDTDGLFAMDSLIHKMPMQHDTAADIENLTFEAKTWCQAYCDGVNHYLETYGAPRLSRFLKVPVHPWTLNDLFTLVKVHKYIGLAQIQERLERFIVQAIHDGVDFVQLKKIFVPYLDSLDEETVKILKKVHLKPYIKMQMHPEPAFSNNWVVSGLKTASGKPLCAHDPHLQINRLPSFWYEVVIETPQDYQMGVTIPGFPGMLMGRTKNLSGSFTYGMMDTIDLFIEEIKDGHYRREEGWKPLVERKEVVKRKKKGDTTLTFFETDAGVIETSSHAIDDGFYISLAWSAKKLGVSPTINAISKLWSADSALKAGEIAREMTLSCNWIFADQNNNIAYQQSGRLPKRKHTTLFPLPAWKKENLWDGFVDPKELSSCYNPPCGFVASANNDKNLPNLPISITCPYSSYRYERIVERLSEDKKFTIDEMKALQCDLYSLQAERFMNQIQDLLPQTEAGNILKTWDCKYTTESKGAFLFEAYYEALMQEVFGNIFGQAAWEEISHQRSLLIFTHGHFDRILLSDDESWFGPEGKKACLKKVLEKLPKTISTWGKHNRFTMHHLLFSGKLGKLLRYNIGPLEIAGSRATVAASFIMHESKRAVAVGACYRSVSDLATDEAHTILAGGPSEKAFSPFYKIDIKKWLNFEYKKLFQR